MTALGVAGSTLSAAGGSTGNDSPSNAGNIFKSVKWNMVGAGKTILEKFQIQKDLGFDGVEMDSPSQIDRVEVLAAARQTNMPIHGVVDSIHWFKRLSSPDPAVRAAGLDGLRTAIDDTHFYGGFSVLLVPGKVTGSDETHDDVWKRSIREIRKVLPLASRKGVRILIENVWNGFCEKPEQLRDYIDEVDSPWFGVYFDIGNHQKFAPSEQWVRVLGRRIVKLDVKDWGRENGFCKLGDGDVNWPEVRAALAEIGFSGWCTAEVQGGNRERLAEISNRMNSCMAL